MKIKPKPNRTVYHAPGNGLRGTLHLDEDCGTLQRTASPSKARLGDLPEPYSWCRRCASKHRQGGDAA